MDTPWGFTIAVFDDDEHVQDCNKGQLIPSEWTEVVGGDLPGEGDFEGGAISNWPLTYTFDELKNICKTNGYSGFLLGKDGTWA